jgi:hypothetical protein
VGVGKTRLAQKIAEELKQSMVRVDGGTFACATCSRDLTDEERRALVATWMRDGFDELVNRIQTRVRDARIAMVPA